MGSGVREIWGTPGRASPLGLLLKLLPLLQQPLHQLLRTVVLLQGPEVLLLQGAPVAKDGHPGAGSSPTQGQSLAV